MKRLLFLLFLIFTNVWALAQQDSIRLNVTLNEDQKSIWVEQTLVYHNPHQKSIHQIKLLNWVSAYQKRKTPLLKRKIEDRKNDLYFAKDDLLGHLESLQYAYGNNFSEILNTKQENIFLPLSEELKSGERITIRLKYKIRLPDARFTGYGVDANHILLKYFFLVPETFENESQSNSFYRDTEETANAGSFWKVNFEIPKNWKIYSNLLEKNGFEFEGKSITDPEFQITKEIYPEFSLNVDGQNVKVDLGYQTNEYQRQILPMVLANHLKFIKTRTGHLPEKLFITDKFMRKEEFIGIDDIKFWKFKFQMFTDYEKTDLDYFSTISKKVMEEYFISNKTKDHWLKNGLKSYLETQYLKQNYPDHKLIGNLADNANIFGIKPLKIFHASKLKLNERYGLAYHYIYTQNLDQKIGTPFYKLSNFNTTAISQFETGSLLNYISEYEGNASFDVFLKQYFSAHYQKKVGGEDFLKSLENHSNGKSSFLKNMMAEKHRINFNLKSFDEAGQDYLVKINKNNAEIIPLKVETEKKSGEKTTFWTQGNAV